MNESAERVLRIEGLMARVGDADIQARCMPSWAPTGRVSRRCRT